MYTEVVKNVTLTAEDQLIEKARTLARSRHTTLNAEFRLWLERYTTPAGDARRLDALMRRLKHVSSGRRFTRDEMNER